MNDNELYSYLCLSENNYPPENFIRAVSKAYYCDSKSNVSTPIFATWNITKYCNFNCRYCSSRAIHGKYVADSDVIEISKKIVNDGIKYVSIIGGEPSLVPQIFEILSLFNMNRVFVTLVTNGINITQNFVEKISSLNLKYIRIMVSLDSLLEQKNDTMRSKGSYSSAVNAIKQLSKYNILSRIQMTVSEQNQNEIVDMYNFCLENSVSSFGFSVEMDFGRGTNKQLDLELIKNQCKSIIQNLGLTRFEKIKLGVCLTDYSKKRKLISYNDALLNEHLKCDGAKSKIHIEPNGDVYPCDFLIYDEFRLGNILTDNYWNSDAAEAFRKINRLSKEHCMNCSNYSCNTGCYARTYRYFKETGVMIPNCKLG